MFVRVLFFSWFFRLEIAMKKKQDLRRVPSLIVDKFSFFSFSLTRRVERETRKRKVEKKRRKTIDDFVRLLVRYTFAFLLLVLSIPTTSIVDATHRIIAVRKKRKEKNKHSLSQCTCKLWQQHHRPLAKRHCRHPTVEERFIQRRRMFFAFAIFFTRLTINREEKRKN